MLSIAYMKVKLFSNAAYSHNDSFRKMVDIKSMFLLNKPFADTYE